MTHYAEVLNVAKLKIEDNSSYVSPEQASFYLLRLSRRVFAEAMCDDDESMTYKLSEEEYQRFQSQKLRSFEVTGITPALTVFGHYSDLGGLGAIPVVPSSLVIINAIKHKMTDLLSHGTIVNTNVINDTGAEQLGFGDYPEVISAWSMRLDQGDKKLYLMDCPSVLDDDRKQALFAMAVALPAIRICILERNNFTDLSEVTK